jgi:hypothetical protein
VDINISNMPLEEIISNIYKEEAEKWESIYSYLNQN